MDDDEIFSDGESFSERHFNSRTTRYQSAELGKIIQSNRKFGVEIEMYNDDYDKIRELGAKLPQSFGLEHDGSISAPGHAIEAVTPILSGKAGENAIVDMFKKINSLDFKVNKTCGLHVHLDGEGFARSEDFNPVEVSNVTEEDIEKVGDRDYAFVVDRDLIHKVQRSGVSLDMIGEILSDEVVSRSVDNMYLSKEFGIEVPKIECREVSLQVGESTLLVDYFTYDKELKFENINGLVIQTHVVQDRDIMFVSRGMGNLQNILTLLYLHTVFGDVFMSMLPKSRRQDNLYCQSLASSLSPAQIESISSYGELENAWYKTKTPQGRERRKRQKYDESRYFSVNLHSLFAKYGTIELRSHSATLDPNKVLYWVSFHQEIMDNILNGRITVDSLRRGATLFNVDDKVEFLMHNLGLRPALVKYMSQRIEYFKNNESK